MCSRNFKTGCTLHHNILQIIMLICFYTFFQAVSSFSFHNTAALSYTSSTSSRTIIYTTPCIRFPLKILPKKVIDSSIKSKKSQSRTPSKLNYSSGSSAVVLPIVRNVIGKAQIFLQNEPTYVLAAIVAIANFGIVLEEKTQVGKALSAALSTMFLSMLCANLGIIPYTSPIYSMVNKNLVPLAVSLLLFDSDLRRVIRDTGSLIAAFFVGAFSTLVGTLVSFPLIPMKAIGSEGWKVASALTARHIGGGINFIAVAETLGISASNVSAALAADNVVVALYFAFLFTVSKEGEEDDEDNPSPVKFSGSPSTDVDGTTITLSSLGNSLAIASFLLFVSTLFTSCFLPKGTSTLPVVSLFTVASATAFPTFFAPLSHTGTAIGVIFVQMFFAASGAAGSIVAVISKAPSMLLFSATQIFVHYVTLMGLGKYVLGLKDRELYIASNANVGGPTTAAAMANGKKWPRLILPGLLVGILGYAIATPLALALGKYVLLRFSSIA
mmetsp:Transcript_12440/g.17891  ORF Transcript_12440/g.17891 Transcript_12440/m.17891 type:complete len:498 (-) Transcript_12440:1117-2610(-)